MNKPAGYLNRESSLPYFCILELFNIIYIINQNNRVACSSDQPFKILNIFLTHIIPNLSSFCIRSTPLESLRKRRKQSLCRKVERLTLEAVLFHPESSNPLFLRSRKTTETPMPSSLFHFHAVFLSGILNCQGKNSPTLDHLGPS